MSSSHQPFFMPLIQSDNYVTPLMAVIAHLSPSDQHKDHSPLWSLNNPSSSSSSSKSICVLCPPSDSRLGSPVQLVPVGSRGWRRCSPRVPADGMPGPRYCIRSLKLDSEAILIFPQVPLMLSAKKRHCITSERRAATAQPSLRS